uniref:LRAT domain-containing protein n=1 Tax=Plectus sambesii TaxID=2011161 RepID=A0A914X9U8_9BILA
MVRLAQNLIKVYHWQIVTYVLEGDVYTHHVTGQNEAEMSVQEELFITIVHYYEKCRRNNGMDAYWTPKDAAQIAKCADCLAGEWKYDLLEQNCEHFVNFCRYGVFESMQVKERTLVAKMAARGSLIAIGASA